mgnify:CR=1 FL=1
MIRWIDLIDSLLLINACNPNADKMPNPICMLSNNLIGGRILLTSGNW